MFRVFFYPAVLLPSSTKRGVVGTGMSNTEKKKEKAVKPQLKRRHRNKTAIEQKTKK
jgi:hypothetical protein